jgi:predicted anti-sigma-YlaC factor YlaD
MRSSRSQLCDRARQWASLRVDGELSELENALLDSHLTRCDGCRSFVREAEAVATALRSVAFERVPAPVVLEFPRRRRVPVRALQAAVAAGLVLVAAALGSVLGVASHDNGATRAAIRRTAMVAMADSPDNLRALRRPTLILQSRPTLIPRNRSLNETV